MNRANSILIVVFLLLARPSIATACSDFPDEPESIYDNEIVFLGEVQSIRENWWKPDPKRPSHNPGILVNYKILRPYKGTSFNQEFVEIATRDFRESGYFEQGEIGLVTANFWEKHEVYRMYSSNILISSCSWNGPAYQNVRMMQEAEERFQENVFQWLSREHPNWTLFVPAVLLLLLIPLWIRQRRMRRLHAPEE